MNKSQYRIRARFPDILVSPWFETGRSHSWETSWGACSKGSVLSAASSPAAQRRGHGDTRTASGWRTSSGRSHRGPRNLFLQLFFRFPPNTPFLLKSTLKANTEARATWQHEGRAIWARGCERGLAPASPAALAQAPPPPAPRRSFFIPVFPKLLLKAGLLELRAMSSSPTLGSTPSVEPTCK